MWGRVGSMCVWMFLDWNIFQATSFKLFLWGKGRKREFEKVLCSKLHVGTLWVWEIYILTSIVFKFFTIGNNFLCWCGGGLGNLIDIIHLWALGFCDIVQGTVMLLTLEKELLTIFKTIKYHAFKALTQNCYFLSVLIFLIMTGYLADLVSRSMELSEVFPNQIVVFADTRVGLH